MGLVFELVSFQTMPSFQMDLIAGLGTISLVITAIPLL